MKKIMKTLALIVIVFNLSMPCMAADKSLPIDDSMRLKNIVATLLMPEINNAVAAFYSQYLTEPPTVVSYSGTQITDIQGGEFIHEGIYNSNYTITVEVLPYVGAHVSVGRDRVTLQNSAEGFVTVVNFEHMESYELTPNLQSLIKKPLP